VDNKSGTVDSGKREKKGTQKGKLGRGGGVGTPPPGPPLVKQGKPAGMWKKTKAH